MKVKISFTLDVDADAWCTEYGTDPSEIRADVKSHVEAGTLAHFQQMGLLTEGNS